MKTAPDPILLRPADASALLVLAHGSGAGMRHPFMEGLARALAGEGVATWRYEFPYMQAGKPFPDRPPVLVASVREAVRAAAEAADGLPLFAGGKSLGGRMTSTAASEGELPGVRGIVFFGFPLHSPKKPGTERAEHLSRVDLPLLFLQGDRDRLADLGLLRPVVRSLGPAATLRTIDDADHGFHVRRASGRGDGEVLAELAGSAASWMAGVLEG
jgi:predicted alpha/beta-hydrolase family hydrolase